MTDKVDCSILKPFHSPRFGSVQRGNTLSNVEKGLAEQMAASGHVEIKKPVVEKPKKATKKKVSDAKL
ncbi:MAG: hypothetical protein ACPGKV_17720 [Alteromonas macleodii]